MVDAKLLVFQPHLPTTIRCLPLIWLDVVIIRTSSFVSAKQNYSSDITRTHVVGTAVRIAFPAALETAIDDMDAPNLFFKATTDNGRFGRGSYMSADRKAA